MSAHNRNYLQLFSLLLQSLLIDGELLGHLGPWLPRQNVLQLRVQLLLLLDQQLLLHNLLRLGYQPLLQRLDLLDELECTRITALKLAPPVHIHWILQLLFQRTAPRPLPQQLTLHMVNLLTQIIHIGHLGRQYLFFPPQPLYFQLQYSQVLNASLIYLLLIINY